MTDADRSAIRCTAAFGGWTVFAWATRIRNAAADTDLDAPAKVVAVGSAVGFTALGVTVLVYAWRHRRDGFAPGAERYVGAFAALTTLWWSVRTVLVWVHDNSTGFRVVHTVLAVVSIALGVAAYRATSRASVRHRQPPPAFKNSPTEHTTTS
ncbi:MAG: hypothetical protein ABIV94_11540 [Acidimicrobiales bacterium]